MKTKPDTEFHQTLANAIKLLDPEWIKGRHALEFGVSSGLSLRVIAYYLGGIVPVFGFDSFEGLPEDWENTPCKKGHFSQDGNVPDIEDTIIYKGWFDATVPQYMTDHPDATIALLHLDADLYSSTKTILEGINSQIVPGTIVVCDEWFYNFSEDYNDHEQRAVLEWITAYGREVEFIDVEDTGRCGMERKVFRVIR
jgi:hypothetical protein